METVAVLQPLMAGFGRSSLKQALVLMPLVGLLVQASAVLSRRMGAWLQNTAGIPPAWTRLGVGLGMMLLGARTLPQATEKILRLTLEKQAGLKGAPLGRLGTQKALSAAALAEETLHATSLPAATSGFASTCARGCTPGGVVCLSELGEVLGGFGTWLRTGASAPPSAEEAPTASRPAAGPGHEVSALRRTF
jgi:hypothetical protein